MVSNSVPWIVEFTVEFIFDDLENQIFIFGQILKTKSLQKNNFYFKEGCIGKEKKKNLISPASSITDFLNGDIKQLRKKTCAFHYLAQGRKRENYKLPGDRKSRQSKYLFLSLQIFPYHLQIYKTILCADTARENIGTISFREFLFHDTATIYL